MDFNDSPTPRRVCIFSQREIFRNISRCSGYEFEDVVAEMESATFNIPTRPASRQALLRARRWMSKRSALFQWIPSGATRHPLEGDVDLFGCFLQKPRELLALDAVPNWRKRSKFAFCVLEELWHVTIEDFRPLVKSLAQFDLITCAFESSCDELRRLTGKPVIHLPGAADLLRFAPAEPAPEKRIDVYYMGRRRPELHEAMKTMLADRGAFYLHDSTTLPDFAPDHRVHRDLLASVVQRSRLFMVDYGKIGHADQATGQIIWGPRHVEGMAGGAVQVGYAPDTEDYRAHFDWPEAIMRLPEDPADATRAIADLLDNPQEQERRRRINLAHAFTRHDWLHRWDLILDFFGLNETPAMRERRQSLRDMARGMEENRKHAAPS